MCGGYPGTGCQGDSISTYSGDVGDILVCATFEQREALLRRVATLPDEAWDVVCPPPDPAGNVVRLEEPRRTVRDVVAHLLVVDEMILRGGALRAWSGITRLEHPGAWDLRRIEPLATQPISELVTLLARRGERFGRLLCAAPAALRRVPVPGPFGRLPLAHLVARRVLHEWLHEHDIADATASDLPRPTSMVSAVLADAVLQLLPDDGLRRIESERGAVRVVVDLEPDAEGIVHRRIWGVDFARRQYGPRVVTPADAVIRTTASALALLANGRGERLGAQPCADIEGDADLGGALLLAMTRSAAPAPCLGFIASAVA